MYRVYSRVKTPKTQHSSMGGGASKPEPAVKGDGVTTVDNSFSVVNIHTTTVVYMSIVVVLIIALIVLIYIYVKRGRTLLLLAPSATSATAASNLPPTSPSSKKAFPQ